MFILNAMPNEVKGNDGWHENSPDSGIIRNISIANLYEQQYSGFTGENAWGMLKGEIEVV